MYVCMNNLRILLCNWRKIVSNFKDELQGVFKMFDYKILN